MCICPWSENSAALSYNSLLHIKSQGSVSGKVFYGDIQIDEGGKLLGEINFKEQIEKEEESKDWKALWL